MPVNCSLFHDFKFFTRHYIIIAYKHESCYKYASLLFKIWIFNENYAKCQLSSVFTARCYASAVLAMALCPSVCPSVRPSVRPSQVGVLLKRLNVGSHKQHHTIPQGLQFSDATDRREIRPGSPPTRAPNAGGVGQNRRLLTNSRLYLENGTRQTHGFY